MIFISIKFFYLGYANGLPDFIGAPYEFWVGANVDIGTSVGQIRVTDMPYNKNLVYDLLHTYSEGGMFYVFGSQIWELTFFLLF